MANGLNTPREAIIPKRGRLIYVVFLFIVLVFAYIIAKDVALPRTVTLPIILIGLAAITFSLLFKPQISLYVLIAYLPFNNILIGRFGNDITGFNLTNLFTIIALLAWLSYTLQRREKIVTKCSLNLPIAVFCLWGLASLINARVIYGSAYPLWDFFILFKRWITPVLLYFIALNLVRDKETFKKVIFIILVVTVIVGLMAIRDYMNDSDNRIGGVFLQPNMLGAFFVYNMFFFLGFFLYNLGSLRYWPMLIAFLICFRGIMVSFSRGAYIACAFGAVIVAFFRSKILFVFSVLALAFVLINPQYMPAGIRHRMSTLYGGDKVISADLEDITDPSAGKRMLIWDGAIEMIKDKPLFGFGYGTFPYIIGAYTPGLHGADAHNTYLIIASEMGIPALLIFILILLMLIKNSWWLLLRSNDRYFKAFALGMLGGVFGLMVANMFGSRLNSEDVSSYFWILAGLTMRAVIFKKKGEIE